MTHARIAVAVLAIAAPFAVVAPLEAHAQATPQASAQATPYAGYYRVTGAAGAFLMRVFDDGRVEVLSPNDGRREVYAPALVRPNLVMGTLGSGETWSIGKSFGRLMMAVGTQLFALTPVSGDDYVATARQAEQGAAVQVAESGGLGGMALSNAKSSLGGYFDGRDYLFCSDGSFRLTKTISGPGVASEKTFAGRWRASGGSIQFQFNDGTSNTLALRRVTDDVFEIGGLRYAAKRSRTCR